MTRAPHLLRSLLFATTLLLPLRTLYAEADVLGCIGALLVDVPLAFFLFREVQRVLQSDADVVVLAPSPVDGVGLGILAVRALCGGVVLNMAFSVAAGSWLTALGATGTRSIAHAVGGWALGVGLALVGVAIAMGERRTEVHVRRGVVAAYGPTYDESFPVAALLFAPAMVWAALRYLVWREVPVTRARGIGVQQFTTVDRRSGRTTRWYVPLLVLDDGRRLRAGDDSLVWSEATRHAQAVASRAGVPYVVAPTSPASLDALRSF